jgi:hypothetical protein
MTDPAALLRKLEATRTETLRRLAALTQDELDWVPPAGPATPEEESWSLGEIFMHLALDEHYLREQIARPLLEGVSPPEGITFLPPPPPYGTAKEVIAFWFERARTLTRRLLEDWPADANLSLTHTGGLEPMNGAEWLAAYAGHEAFHHRQIDAVLEKLRAAVEG